MIGSRETTKQNQNCALCGNQIRIGTPARHLQSGTYELGKRMSGQWLCSETCVEKYTEKLQGKGSSSGSGSSLTGQAVSGAGKLAGQAATTVGSYAWKKMTGQKSEEDIAREKHNMEMKQAKEQLKQDKEDRKEAKKEAKRSRRNERAKELESEGKTFAAFWVRNQRWLLPLIIITAMIIMGKFMGEEQPANPETNTETTIEK